MHDYHKAKEIIESVTALAQKQNEEKVREINFCIGIASGYSADSVKFYFEDLKKDTICENAVLNVSEIISTLECPKCKNTYPRNLLDYKCPKCKTEGVPNKNATQTSLMSVKF